jgi:phospholipid/cholesterol/gamma-HCH transport system substrate-binding protein
VSPVRQRLLGLGFVVFMVGMLLLSVLVYKKAFTPVAWVTLRTDHAGMQLSEGADVKYRGVRVGEVRSITADGTAAVLRLAIDPSQIGLIPASVNARLLPKTLFGERYVEMVGTGGPSLRPNAVIDQDRSSTAVELERILDQALPLLQAIKPDKLAATLGAWPTRWKIAATDSDRTSAPPTPTSPRSTSRCPRSRMTSRSSRRSLTSTTGRCRI